MFKEELLNLLKIKKPIIWIKTHEEKEAIIAIKNIIDALNEYDNMYLWSQSSGITKMVIQNNNIAYEKAGGPGIDNLISKINMKSSEDVLQDSVFVLRDLHLTLNNPNLVRAIRDITEVKRNKYIPLIVTSPIADIPLELDKLIAVIDYDFPSTEDIEQLLIAYEDMFSTTIENKADLSVLFTGFSRQEIIETISMSIIKTGKVDMKEVANKKIEIIKKTGILDYKEPKVTLEEVGGNDFFKKWIRETEYCMSNEAALYGIPKPKGYLALGIPGSSKSFTAEALANKFNMPFLKLDMSKIMSKLVGESERNAARAISLIESCAPCVLLIDEVEKTLSGHASSNSSDSGVLSRVFGKILEFLNDNDKGVFVIMTSNDVSQLPPELTRAGRLDAIFYFGLPDETEREEIFKVHFNKIKQTVSKNVINLAVKETISYTGAEIEQIVKIATKKAFIRMKQQGTEMLIKEEDILSAKEQVIPISKSSKEKINQLEIWAKGRALYASKKEKKVKINVNDII